MRNRSNPFFAGALFLGSMFLPPLDGGPSNTGTLEGQILFEGGPAPRGVVAADAVVYLVGEDLDAASVGAAHGETPVLNQRDLTFTPHVLPLVVGTKVDIRNSDGITHNVHSSSRKNRPFNRAQLANMKLTMTFRVPEIIAVSCDIHSQMSAYIVVVPNRFFASAGADGAFTISGIPAGTYELVAWHEAYGRVSTQVTITGGSATEVDVNLLHSTTNTGAAR